MNDDINRRRIEVMEQVISALSKKDIEGGRRAIKEGYPFVPRERHARSYTNLRKLNIFMRDGFIDRYSGEKLIFPGTLKVFSAMYPIEFPYHKNGKMTLGHMAYWHLMPTIDHIEPFAAGGHNGDDNLVTTSMMNNGVKANFTLEELNWKLYPKGNINEWDGMTGWFRDYVEAHRSLLSDKYIDNWYRTLLRLGND